MGPIKKLEVVYVRKFDFLKLLLLLLLYAMGVAIGEDVTEVAGDRDCESVIGCECQDLYPIAGIACDNVTDFGSLSKHLRDGSLHEVNETYEITITGTETLPSRSFVGLIVYRLYIDDAVTRNMLDRVFEGVLRLRRLHVRRSSMEKIPDLSLISHSLRNMNFDNSLLTAIGHEVQNLPLLRELTFRKNRIWRVDPEAFKGSEAIKQLDLSGNLLEYLPPTLLDKLSRLWKLVLSRNRLLSVSGLLRVVRPKMLYLGNNNLTDADGILYENMTATETITLNDNPFLKISKESFNGKVPRVRFLFLDNCGIDTFDVEHFNNLSRLAILELSGNNIEAVGEQVIQFGDRLNLHLNNNGIRSFEAQITYVVKRLQMSGNKMKRLGTTLHLTQLQEIIMNRNGLEALVESDLQGVHSTENLMLRGNSIRRIDTDVFVPVRNDLQVLDLSVNQIHSLNGSVRYLSRLKALNISMNFIKTLREGEFVGLNELSELYMQHNRILVLSGQLQRIPRLQYLIIRNNEIRTMRLNQFPKSLRFLYYRDNPMSCDCRLMPFLEWLSNSSLQTDFEYCQEREYGDDEYQRALRTVAHASLAEDCPETCKCSCVQEANGSYMEALCNSRNLSSVPQTFLLPRAGSIRYGSETGYWLSLSKVLKQNTDTGFVIADRVRSLNFEDNRIESVDDLSVPSDLLELRLSNNQLGSLPELVRGLSKLRTVSLSGNPWICDCSAVDFKNWIISKADGVVDKNETRCGFTSERDDLANKVVVNLSDVDLCPSYIGLYISVAFALLIVLLLLSAAKIAYNRYELHIKIWLYSHGVSWVKEKDLDRDKPFDAFISFSNKDEDFVVSSIISEIEENLPEIRLCLHYRDFLPGEYIHVNIMNAIASSKRTVIVLSRNFLESEWCMLEFRAAHMQALEDKVQRLIVVRVGDLPEDLDPTIKVYLDSTTYVTWGEKYFWQKFIYALPSPRRRCRNDSSTTML